MSNLKDARTYGGIGSILSTFGIFIPLLGIWVAIAGIILEILAVDKIASEVNDREIFKSYLISAILSFIGPIVAIFVGTMLFGISVIEFAGSFPMPTRMNLRIAAFPILVFSFLALLVVWILEVIAAVFLKKSFDSIAKKLNISMFGTAALVYLIGAATLILVVGLLIIFVASILKIVAYFSIPETTTQAPS